MSTGRPSAINGMSSAGAILETTPLLPWRPAILSPGCKRRLTAKYTLTIFVTPGCKSSPWVSLVRFSSKASSNCLRFASIEDLIASTCEATSSSAGRTSNQWYLSKPARYSLSILVPLANFWGPPLATLPINSFSKRMKASPSTIRNWSFKSKR